MDCIRGMALVMATTMVLLGVSLAQSEVMVSACVEQLALFDTSFGYVTLSPTGEPTSTSIGTWTGTYGFDVLENDDYDLLVQDQTQSTNCFLSGLSLPLNTIVEDETIPIPGLEIQLFVKTIPYTIGTEAATLELSQEVQYSDPKGSHAGYITLALSPHTVPTEPYCPRVGGD